MGSQFVSSGKTTAGTDYRIYNIDNVYTVYIKTGTRSLPENPEIKRSVFSAIKSFATLGEAKKYMKEYDTKS